MKSNLLNTVLTFLLLALTQILLAQQTGTLQLEETVISAGRVKAGLSETFKCVEVISKEEIAGLPVQTLAGILEYAGQVDIRQRGVLGVQADLSIRGGTFEQTLILLNGVKISDPQTAHHNLNFYINPANIQRIEILKGPGARIYGQNAFSGAINIVTKADDTKNLRLQFAGGENNYLSGEAVISYPVKKYHQTLSVGSSGSKGYITNSDFNLVNFFYQSSWKDKVDFVAGFNTKEFGANGFYTNLFPWQWESTQTAFSNISFHSQNIRSDIYYRRNTDEFLLKRDTPDFYRNYHVTGVLGMDVNTEFTSKAGKTSIGGEFRRENIVSANLGDHQRYSAGLFLEHRFVFHQLIVTPGMLISWYSSYTPALFPGIDAGYYLSSDMEIYAGIGRTYRIPTFTELYYLSPANKGNPELQPEIAISYELGWRYKTKNYNLSISVFRRDAENLIDWTRNSNTDAWMAKNITEISTEGFSASASLSPLTIWPEIPVNKIGLSYSYLDANRYLPELLSKNVLDYLHNQIIFTVNYSMTKNLIQVWKIRYEDRLGYEPHTLIDSRISFKLKNLNLYIEASNIFNIRYFEFGGLEMPGRWARFGADIKIRKPG